MDNKDSIKQAVNDITATIKGLLPNDLKSFRDDFSANVKIILQNKLHALNLVTREEFDVQVALLEKNREKLELLENELKRLKNSSTLNKETPEK